MGKEIKMTGILDWQGVAAQGETVAQFAKRDPDRCMYCDQSPCVNGGTELCEGFFTLALPPGPLCAVCFHEPCPCCPDAWCDRLTDDGLCCDGECKIDPGDLELWRAQVDEANEGWPHAIQITQVAEGPWCPVAIQRERAAKTTEELWPESLPKEAPKGHRRMRAGVGFLPPKGDG